MCDFSGTVFAPGMMLVALVSERRARPSCAAVLGEAHLRTRFESWGWTWLPFCQDLFCIAVLLLTLLSLRSAL